MWSDGRKALVTRLIADAAFELRRLPSDLVTWQPARVVPGWKLHAVDGAGRRSAFSPDAGRSDICDRPTANGAERSIGRGLEDDQATSA